MASKWSRKKFKKQRHQLKEEHNINPFSKDNYKEWSLDKKRAAVSVHAMIMNNNNEKVPTPKQIEKMTENELNNFLNKSCNRFFGFNSSIFPK